ncbi:S9 family peptidase [Caulobacter mirabilis]|uniref:Acyl-peptide hydrolase n=1 Tax=Caulobacter mirabilis TaxID=69666 RepID=A0A2D2AZE8_9CAUL|nr:alpha/beta fold hydrolase [Caulobacter mirabilis]ATQ43365.1 hypothetical protein CSW64_13545 [Caulobacter mirabilis]
MRLSRCLLFAVLACILPTGAFANPSPGAAFLDFPIVLDTTAAKIRPAFAWLVRQGSTTKIVFAEGPRFERREMVVRSDVDGRAITAVWLSPDGLHLVFRTAAPITSASAYNPASLLMPPQPELWLASTRGKADPRRIGVGVSPVFAPDGRVAFRGDGDLRIVTPGAEPPGDQVVARGGGFSQIAWAQDGRSFVFVSNRGAYDYIGRYEIGTDRIEWIVTGAERLASPRLSPDGRSVAYLRFPGRSRAAFDATESQPLAIETASLETLARRTVWASADKASEPDLVDPDQALRWTGPDALTFYSEHDGWGRLYEIGLAGGVPRARSGEGCEVAESEVVGEGRLLLVDNCVDRQARRLRVVDREGRVVWTPPRAEPLVGRAVAAGDLGYALYVGADADNAPLARIVDLNAGRLVLAERAADYGYSRGFDAPPPREVRFAAADGLELSGQLFLPASRGPHPALVYVHGGPRRQMHAAFHLRAQYAFEYAINRRLAELGFVVLSVNYRSGTGYGRAFREAPLRGWRGASEYQDILAAHAFLAARPEVDRARIGIWGGSYGGMLAAQALARNSDLFAAGVAIHGVFDWGFRSNLPNHLNPSRLFGVGDADRARATENSPVAAIAGWRSPVLLFSGDQDMNVDVLETVDLAARLVEQGVDARTVLVPGESHDFERRETWDRLWREQSIFLQRTLGPSRAAP